MGSLCNADGSKIMTEDDGYETIVPDLSASEQAVAQHEGGRGEPFMPVVELSDDMLMDTGSEKITWGELRARLTYAPATRPAALAEEVARLREALEYAAMGLRRIHSSLASFGPKQASGEMTAHFLDRALAALNEQPGVVIATAIRQEATPRKP